MAKINLKVNKNLVICFCWTTLFCWLSSIFFYSIFFGILGIILFSFFNFKEKRISIFLSLIIFLSFTLHHFINAKIDINHDFENKIFTITQIKSTYLILENNFKKYYLNSSNITQDLFLFEKISLSGKFEKINFISNYYQFNLNKFYGSKGINQEIIVDKILAVTDNWKSKINKFYNVLLSHEFAQIFLLNNHDKNFQLIKATNDLSITYLLNFSGLSFLIISQLIRKICKKQQKGFQYLLLASLDSIWLFILFTIGFPFITTRACLTVITKNFFNFKNIKTNSANIWIVVFSFMVCFDNSIILSKSFLYYVVAILFIKYNPLKKLWKEITINIIVCTLSFGIVNMFIDYRFFYFNEIFDLIFGPVLALTNLFVLFTFWIPKIEIIYNFWQNILIKEFIFLTSANLFYACGNIPLYFYLSFFIFLKLSLIYYKKVKITFLILTVILLIIIFLFKFINFRNGFEILNVGNGQSTILKTRKNIILFDVGAGPGYSKSLLSDYLKYYGITKIDYLFISHYHDDHYNQLEKLQENSIKIRHLIKREMAENYYHINNEIQLHVFNRNFLNLPNENNNSLVIFFKYKNKNFLIMNDLEKEGEEKLLNDLEFKYLISKNKVDFMLLGHHGSKTSSSYNFLNFVRPSFCYISGEKQGKRQFPNNETVQTLNNLKIKYFVTNSKNNYFIKIK